MRDWVEATRQVRLFADFLTAAWPTVKQLETLSSESSFVDDWMESSWEQLVEAALPEDVLLTPYAPADMHPNSSRVFRPDLPPTHAMVFLASSSDASLLEHMSGALEPVPEGGFAMGDLVGPRNGGFSVYPPFTHVRIEDEQGDRVFELSALTFWAKPLVT